MYVGNGLGVGPVAVAAQVLPRAIPIVSRIFGGGPEVRTLMPPSIPGAYGTWAKFGTHMFEIPGATPPYWEWDTTLDRLRPWPNRSDRQPSMDVVTMAQAPPVVRDFFTAYKARNGMPPAPAAPVALAGMGMLPLLIGGGLLLALLMRK